MKELTIEFFQNAGRRGGQKKTARKREAVRKNLEKARKARWGKRK